MESFVAGSCPQGTIYHRFLLLTVWFCGFHHVLSRKTGFEPEDKFMLSDPPLGLFDPIEISPAVLPHNINPVEPFPPMYPNFTSSYVPVLSGRCDLNFSSISDVLDKTASDCSVPLAPLVANVICCPQANSLMNIFQAAYTSENNSLVLNQAASNDCFSDVMSILASRGANTNIPALCSLSPSNLTDASCPVKDVSSFERLANASKLLDACSSIDPLKECCRPECQPAIMEAALRISSGGSMTGSSAISGTASGIDVVSDCKGVVHAWLSRKLSSEDANTAFRVLSGCKVNKVCPLELDKPTKVIKACGEVDSPSASCCAALHTYISTRQKQIFVTNRQAINCATLFGSMLQKAGVVADVYELCGIDLKDFSLQAFGQQGCLLRSLPTDIVFDNVTGISFICDLSDNIAAPWPSSSSVQSLSLCAPEMSLPALPAPVNSASSGYSITRTTTYLLLILYSIMMF